MDYSLIICLAAFISSLAVSLAGTRALIFLGPKMGWIEQIKEDRWHSKPTVKLGGIAIYISLMVVTIVYFWPLTNIKIVGLLAGTTMVFILGLADDLKSVSPGIKILVEAAAAAVVVAFGVYSEYFSPILGIPLTIFWIIAITNAYNLIDNMDGLSSGIAAISAATLFALSAIMGWADTAILSAVMCGAACGFLRYNFNPARIFMGDCGALTIGFYLSVVTLVGSMTYMSNLLITLVAPMLVMAVPILDTTYVTVLRAASGRPVYQGGKDHTSHRLVVMGLSEKRSVLAIYLFSLVFGGFAVLLAFPGASHLLVWTLLVICLVFLFLLGIFLSGPDIKKIENRVRANNGTNGLAALLMRKRHIVVEIAADALIVAASYILAYYLMGNGTISRTQGVLIGRSLPIFVFFQMISFYLFGVYRGVWKYVSFGDMIRIVGGALAGTAVSALVLFLFTFFTGYSVFVVIVYFFVMTFLIAARAASLRSFTEYFTRHRARRAQKRVIIFGAGDSGNTVLREILNNGGLDRRPLAFIDDDPAKTGKIINGIKVLGTRDVLGRVIREKEADELIVAISDLSAETQRYIQRVCKESKIAVVTVSGILNIDG
jgi:UDP-GlcNAc:undecaprenyl-phosphate/decaprenyl-phosphate GlcNAc-1-phosphate transferase